MRGHGHATAGPSGDVRRRSSATASFLAITASSAKRIGFLFTALEARMLVEAFTALALYAEGNRDSL
jgi:hypothetical protein